MTCLVLPNLGYPDGVFILSVSGDDVAQATRQVLRALLQQSEQRVALPRFAGHFADQAVHLRDSLPYDLILIELGGGTVPEMAALGWQSGASR